MVIISQVKSLLARAFLRRASIPQAHGSAQRAKPEGLRSKTFCGYYITIFVFFQYKTKK